MPPFSAKVELPCRVFCGPDSMLQLSGRVLNIDTGSLVLALPEERTCPDIGERVRLELLLPVNAKSARAKCLNVSARVVGSKEMPDGSWQFVLKFRKASFKDVQEADLRKLPKAAGGWEM